MLRGAAWTSGALGAASGALFLAFWLARPIPEPIAWPMAYAIVVLGMLSLAGFSWIVLSLPPGAPWRRRGLQVALALLGLAFGSALVAAGPGAPAGGLGAATAMTGVMLVRER